MKKLIVMLGLVLCFSAFAQDESEASWKSTLRTFITRVAGVEWSTKLLGEAPRPRAVEELALPEIPQNFKKSTDVSSYTKKTKEPTAFDKLPSERKRQFNYRFLEELFLVTRQTQAKDEDLANWLNTLEQGGSREGIYQALVLDEVYNGLESIEGKPSAQLLDYCLVLSQNFFKQTFKQESLSQLNLYSLKRIFTEKGLDLLEYYESRDLEALYRWYSLVSAHMAKTHADLLTTELRKSSSASVHYEWAKSMPIQHIMSEYIIKMHSIMNKLQLVQK